MDAFRFSISWARLIPSGKVKDGVNKEGVKFYNALIDELIANKDFRDFSRVCFEEFGDKVKMWTTINEPYVITVAGYDTGNKAVGRCSKWVNSQCQAGDSGSEPYIASHHLLLAHAAAVHEFRKCNKTSKDGQIGIVLSPLWFEPYDSTSLEDKEAVKRAVAIELDWNKLLKSSDFIGFHRKKCYIAHLPHVDPARPRFKTDQQLEWRVTNHSNHKMGPEEERRILYSVPEGLRKVLNYIKDKYNNPTVYIKENGINDYDDGTKSKDEILSDIFRIKYHEDHLQQLHKAIIEDGCDVRGYYVWSLLDNFEWEHGYSTRFGLYYVDYDNNLKRYPKDSVNWFKQFLSRIVVKSD
ncbi:hypothetical protein Bca52824_029377 [Brassica carinata]|uniref:thioglucosidase n=1 Tax=Brassica carinata TaxID=52824 RepID=A0A8X7VE43_BRACI|nr:hypothetical protein Bca52824_029377 [Brassica carinata]